MLRPQLTEHQRENRAINAVAILLQRRLLLPKIYFEAPWPTNFERVDLLAIDRSGSGEIHAVEAAVSVSSITSATNRLLHVPAHYRYLAIYIEQSYRPTEDSLYASDGFGRIGLIEVREGESGELGASVAVSPERFRLAADVFKKIDRFSRQTTPDIEIRP